MGKVQVYAAMHKPGSVPERTDRQALPLAHLCLQKTHWRLSFSVCEAFICSRSNFSIKRQGLYGPSPFLVQNLCMKTSEN